MIRSASHLWPFLVVVVVVLVAVPSVAAEGFGTRTVTEASPLVIPQSQVSHHLCVASRGAVEEVVLSREDTDGGSETVTFRPGRDAADCLPVEAGTYRPEEGVVDVLVISRSPREVTSPSVLRLERVGAALLIEDPTEAADIGLLLDRPGQEAVVVTQKDLVVIGTAEGVGEERFALADLEGWEGRGVFVVYMAAGEGGGAVLVDWQDEGWYRRAPSLGHVGVVVAIALFVVLYHGRTPRVEG